MPQIPPLPPQPKGGLGKSLWKICYMDLFFLLILDKAFSISSGHEVKLLKNESKQSKKEAFCLISSPFPSITFLHSVLLLFSGNLLMKRGQYFMAPPNGSSKQCRSAGRLFLIPRQSRGIAKCNSGGCTSLPEDCRSSWQYQLSKLVQLKSP